MSKKSSEKNRKKKSNSAPSQRQAWIPRDTGYTAITLVSVVLAIWVGWQTVSGGGTLWKGILWGLIFGASIWLVFFGMNYFHSLFGKTNNNKKD